ncbi:hypothetical protein ACFL55_02725 [Candidatus Latescibacterota bacterium]
MKRWSRSRSCCAAYLAAVALLLMRAPGASEGAEPAAVRILFTNNANGKLTACNCPDDPYGGLAERVSLITAYRESNSDIMLVDSGGYFGLTEDESQGRLVFELMGRMGYDVIGIGDQELYHGLGTFLDRYGAFRKRIVSATLLSEDGERVFQPYRIVTTGGVRIGIIGLVSDETFRFFPAERRDFRVANPDSVLADVLPALADSCEFIVVLSQLGVEGDKRLAERWPAIGLIMGGHSQTLLAEPLTIGGTAIVQAGKNGGRVGEVVLTRDPGGTISIKSYRLIEVTDQYPVRPEIKELLGGAVDVPD